MSPTSNAPFGSASPSDLAAGRRSNRPLASALNRSTHGSLRSRECMSERWAKNGGLMLDHNAWQAAQDYLDAAEKIDATARTVDVAHPDGDTLD